MASGRSSPSTIFPQASCNDPGQFIDASVDRWRRLPRISAAKYTAPVVISRKSVSAGHTPRGRIITRGSPFHRS